MNSTRQIYQFGVGGTVHLPDWWTPGLLTLLGQVDPLACMAPYTLLVNSAAKYGVYPLA